MKSSILIIKLLSISFIIVVACLCSSFSTHSFIVDSDYKEINYNILSGSVLEVHGKTNINSFCCTSKETFAPKSIDYLAEPHHSAFHFKKTQLDINIEQLDCGRKKINKDLYKALRVEDYPNISILLKELINIECQNWEDCGNWIPFIAHTDITITCKTRTVDIPVQVKKLDDLRFRVTGGTSLQLCDFDVEAPTVMLGLIKVKDEILVDFDLYLDLQTS